MHQSAWRERPGDDGEPERRPVVRVEEPGIAAGSEMRRAAPERGRPVALDGSGELLRLESGQQNGTGADRPCTVERVQAIQVRERRRAPGGRSGGESGLARAYAAVAEERAEGMRSGFGGRGRAR